jgi:hypothetical protein
MKQLLVPKLSLPETHPDLAQISRLLDSHKHESVETAPWPAYPYKPEVSFSIGHNAHTIFLKYIVAEKETRTLYTQTNDPVYRDSCVEFFISFDGGAAYYNLEFNSRGVCLAGYGRGRDNRELLPPAIIEKIECIAVSDPSPGSENSKWELCLAIPVEVFCHDNLDDLTGKAVKANFYKCGDDLAEPHFLAWNQIISDEPNFHLPQYFGELNFASNTNTLN